MQKISRFFPTVFNITLNFRGFFQLSFSFTDKLTKKKKKRQKN